MKLVKWSFLLMLLLVSGALFAKGGDDVGNGGFAYKQSVKILKMAAASLEEKIRVSTLKDIVDYPERRKILEDTLLYENLEKLSKKNQYRGGRKLAMNYIVNPPTVIVLKSYFEAFMGKTDPELEEASLEVQKRLLHEASHIWGYKEVDSEKFSIAFLKNVENPPVEENRPSDIVIGDFCSCINGRSDSAKKCDKFCATKPLNDQSILYVNTILGTESTKIFGNLYNWCARRLSSDTMNPECRLQAVIENNSVSMPINISFGSNSFSANISSLTRNKEWSLRLFEHSSNAQSNSFQVRKVDPAQGDLPVRKIRVMPINQYACDTFGGKIDQQGNVIRTSSVRINYYFQSAEMPRPMPPAHGKQSMIVCHDEERNPGDDSAEYERLEQYNDHLRFLNLNDTLFNAEANGKLVINKILSDRLLNEYGITTNINIFTLLSFASTPGLQSSLGFALIPFTEPVSGKTYCPTTNDYTGNQPLFNVLGDYIDDTEALYIAEKEAETILDGNTYKTFYGTMMIRESFINKNGFYIENGLKKTITDEVKHSGATVYYYWPSSNELDPLIKGNRKLFAVRSPGGMNGNVPAGIGLNYRTSDKRIGCIPKGAEL